MCWNSGEGTRTYRVRPAAWLNRVGLSHVSNDWRMTFFSSAERIWIQGLSAVVVEIANAIELILLIVACVALCTAGTNHPRGFGNGSVCAQSLSFSPDL